MLVAQDLVYHRTHLFLGNNDIAGWQAAIGKLVADERCDTILAGHGLPADRDAAPLPRAQRRPETRVT